ncbi:MAG: hypothetical protein AAF039_17530 [Bacteroidota bacterium]
MEDILKSGLLGITLLITLIFSAPILNDTDQDIDKMVAVKRTELQTEKDIHIPL